MTSMLAEAVAERPGPRTARPSVSVVVCAFTEDRWEDLARAVGSLRRQAERPREIILVVDHCPGLLRRARRELSAVTVVPNRFERGLSGGRNTGAAVATGEVVAFLDDDAVADPGWISKLADGYGDASVLGVGGEVRPLWDTGRPRWFPPELDWIVGCSYRGMPVRGGQVRNFIGANMSFRREVLAAAGGFTAGLGRVGTVPLGCEETELCLRVAQRYPGGVLRYEPAAAVGHRVRPQRATWRYLRSRCYAEGLSKARVSELAGSRRALSAERSYLWSAVGRAVFRSLAQTARGRFAGVAAALALAAAVVWTGAGFLAGRLSGRRLGSAPGKIAPGKIGPGKIGPGKIGRAPWAGLAAGVAVWGSGLAHTDAARVAVSGLGLAGVLPVTFWAGLGLVTAGFGWAVTRAPGRWFLLGAHLLTLVIMLHGTPAIVYGTLRYSWSWKHVGVTAYIARHGVNFGLGGLLGAYQGWPGFFALNAFLTGAAGLKSALSYASWALVANDVLWLGPVLLIARAFTANRRLIWTAGWLFELGNWVGQDYFSPQALAFFLYLTVLAICLRWLADPRGGPAGHPAPSPATRYALMACLVPLMAAIASSHQLTPFMLIASLTVLAVFRQLKPKALPVLLAVVTALGWIGYGARPWLAANGYQIFQGLGVPWANTSAHLIGQGAIPADQALVNWGARLLSAAVGICAVIGFWRYRRHHGAADRRSWNRIPLLALASVLAVAANSYGGEIIFRVYLFALPFLAVAAAAAFFPREATARPAGPTVRARRPWIPGLALVTVSLVLAAGFSLGNYGKDGMNYFTPAEVAASQWLYRTAPRGAQVVAANSNFPWAFVHYDWYRYTFLDTPAALGRAVRRAPVSTMINVMGPGRSPASYLILTASQAAEISLTGEWPPGAYARVVRALLASGDFRVVYRNAGAIVLELSQ